MPSAYYLPKEGPLSLVLVDKDRLWSLIGGPMQEGETPESCILRVGRQTLPELQFRNSRIVEDIKQVKIVLLDGYLKRCERVAKYGVFCRIDRDALWKLERPLDTETFQLLRTRCSIA